MHLVKDDEFNIPDQISSSVEHTPQDLGRHDETRRLRVDLHISSEDAHVLCTKRLLELSELLVGQCLDG